MHQHSTHQAKEWGFKPSLVAACADQLIEAGRNAGSYPTGEAVS